MGDTASRQPTLTGSLPAESQAGRLYLSKPIQGELHYLRIFSLSKKGAWSSEGLRTVAGVCHSTYKDAANAGGVIDDDQENHCRLDGAKDFSSPAVLRQLFSYLLVFGNVQQPTELLARWLRWDRCQYSRRHLDLLVWEKDVMAYSGSVLAGSREYFTQKAIHQPKSYVDEALCFL